MLNDIKNQVLEDHSYVVSLRRYFHMYPEISKNEFNTAAKIEEELKKIGLNPTRVGETGVYASLKGNVESNKVLVLRADIDALALTEKHECSYTSKNQGVMHACGHDAHAAALLGAARILVKHKDEINGEVRFVFQQAEEVGYGARVFIEKGYLNGATRSFGLHVASDLEVGKVAFVPGPNNASVDWFKIKVNGKQAHVSTPQKGVDALYIASQIVVAVQGLISRMLSPMDNALIGIGKLNAGTAYNIVAGSAEIEGTLRTLTKEIRKSKISEIVSVAENIAKIYGGSVDIEWKDFTSPLINDLEATKEAQKVASLLFGDENLIKMRTPSLGGDDFAEFINVCPGVYGYVGTKNSSIFETTVAHHNEYFDIDEDSLNYSVMLYSSYALTYLGK